MIDDLEARHVVRTTGALVAVLSVAAVVVACVEGEPPGEPAVRCYYELNKVRTILDADLRCPLAPRLVLCSGRTVNARFDQTFDVEYRTDGRVAQQHSTSELSGNGTKGFAYEDNKLIYGGGYSYVYDDRDRLERVEWNRSDDYKTFHYDESDRLIRIEDSYHGTFHFDWRSDGSPERISDDSGTIRQTFELDAEGRLARYGARELEYDDGDLVRIGDERLTYTDEPLDIPPLEGFQQTWFLTGRQGEAFIRVGSRERPWRVYVDYTQPFLLPEYHPAHRLEGTYRFEGDAVIQETTGYILTFTPAQDCVDAALACVPERCDNPGEDDDCNGVVDDVPGVDEPCDSGLAGICAGGTGRCDGEAFVCAADYEPGIEWCDDLLDQNCDGMTDELGCRRPPAWSACINRTIDYFSCDSYCAFVGQSCTPSCATSRGFDGYGAEAWTEGDACGGIGEGQRPCDFAWDDDVGDLPRWRCCCE